MSNLPFLPGLSFNQNLGKNNFSKSHQFDLQNGVAVFVGEEKPGIGGEPVQGQKLKPKFTTYPKSDGFGSTPAWIAFDKQVLRFDAYFQEAVQERREENYRIRMCKVLFYLEDDTIQVVESQQRNSGMPQGTILRRHRIALPSPNDDEFYSVDHFNIGNELSFYGKTFKIVDCDVFTRNFLKKLGVKLNDPIGAPKDPYTEHRRKLDDSMQPRRPYEKEDNLKQFLEHDRHVLRFYCLWDDTENMFGDEREMILHFFLADETIEIREAIPPNAGRDTTSIFIHRQKLPRGPTPLLQPGEKTNRTVLNVFGTASRGGRYIIDSLKTGSIASDFYTERDLAIGNVLNVYGRRFLLCDCDEFTKEYYSTKYGIKDIKPIQIRAPPQPLPPRQYPPYNGFGSEEDSLGNCLSLIPKPPRRDFIKFVEKDRKGLETNILRFYAKMDTAKPIDVDRRFIVSYFLSDDTIKVFEPPQRNSGIIGGKFFERGRVADPSRSTEGNTTYYSANDLFIGARVIFYRHQFILIDADEYAFRYMEKNAREFPYSDINRIINVLRNHMTDKEKVKGLLINHDPTGAGEIPYEALRHAIRQITGNTLNEHELMTLGRYYGDVRDDTTIEDLAAAMQEQLKQSGYDRYQGLRDIFTHYDNDRSGCLDKYELLRLCRSHQLPVKNGLLWALIARMPNNKREMVSYNEFIHLINWTVNPIDVRTPPKVKQTLDRLATERWDDQENDQSKPQSVNLVYYKNFLNDVCGQES
ncbi:EF-hand domain-containing family member C2 [Trichoplax sp. H2]|uniref:EF-hand domain-containing family member C2 n=1 Tax=Trichoplax adhaerens TaxID=10228 RepID=B3RTZ8_TRIAD|nr:hypothetical protein TRIADDRAFT_56103 [Trichoplax adhaerens]EDV26223.1 hypothetical protein TRIADDRAFT_56103 [Trichoplax adhaerens]RDD37447.1 EF-hand domain-containing family member C2 [Trichoplax sp. H2]|eukprot:XP_002112256.1 hypothetical protein TRIADDRAFT_56103 [Trichoplax adhaerens]